MKYVLGGLAFFAALGVIVVVIRNERREVQKAVQTTIDQGVDTAIDKAIDKSPEVVGKTIDAAGDAIGKVLRPREKNEESDDKPGPLSVPSNDGPQKVPEG